MFDSAAGFTSLLRVGTKRRGTHLSRARFFDLAAGFTPVLGVKAKGGATYLVSTEDRRLGMRLFSHRQRSEMIVLRQALKVLAELGLADRAIRGTFVDVGANIGTSTITALLEHGFRDALACEPAPGNYRLLRLNAMLNGLDDRVRTVPAAVSDREGPLHLSLHRANSGGNAVVATGTKKPPRWDSTIAVEGTTLDALVKSGVLVAEDVGLVWIDVQGHEGHVLQGASSLVERGVPIVLEFHPGMLSRAGGLHGLEEAVAAHYEQVIDLRCVSRERLDKRPSSAIEELSAAYSSRERGKMTDLLLVGPRR